MGPPSQRLVNKVNGAARPTNSVLERLPVRMKPRKGRKQARMNIEHAPAKSLREFRRKYSHVTGQTNQLDSSLIKSRDDSPVMLDTRLPATLNHQRLQPALASVHKTRRVFLIANYNRNLRIRDAPLTHSICQRHHVRPTTRNENANTKHKLEKSRVRSRES